MDLSNTRESENVVYSCLGKDVSVSGPEAESAQACNKIINEIADGYAKDYAQYNQQAGDHDGLGLPDVSFDEKNVEKGPRIDGARDSEESKSTSDLRKDGPIGPAGPDSSEEVMTPEEEGRENFTMEHNMFVQLRERSEKGLPLYGDAKDGYASDLAKELFDGKPAKATDSFDTRLQQFERYMGLENEIDPKNFEGTYLEEMMMPPLWDGNQLRK